MLEHLKDAWGVIALMIVGLIGMGEAKRQLYQQSTKIKALEDSEYCTMEFCKAKQAACSAVQGVKHSQYKEESVKLMRLIEHVSEKSDEHYEKMISRIDANARETTKQMISFLRDNK